LDSFFFLLREPKQSCLKISERPHLPAPQPADERKHARAAVRIAPVKHCQTLVPAKSSLVECSNEPGQFCRCKQGPNWHWQRPQVQHSAINPTLSARLRQHLKGALARLEIEVSLCAHANELARTNDLQL